MIEERAREVIFSSSRVRNCSLPTCKGKAGEHFDAGGFCPKCRNESSHHFCKRRHGAGTSTTYHEPL